MKNVKQKIVNKLALKIFFRNSIISCITIFASCASKPQSANPYPIKIYESPALLITQIDSDVYIHTSYLQTESFGNVPCNGMIVANQNEAIIFDSPTNDTNSTELIKWLQDTLQCKIKAVIPTHFHEDCLGGLNAFKQNGISSYAYVSTKEMAKKNNVAIPDFTFNEHQNFKVGNETVETKYLGSGHTRDNIIAYYPKSKIMFGGCLIKELGATKGYLGDADTLAWSSTIQKIKSDFRDVKIVIPGHGQYGDKALLDYTQQLFENKTK